MYTCVNKSFHLSNRFATLSVKCVQFLNDERRPSPPSSILKQQ